MTELANVGALVLQSAIVVTLLEGLRRGNVSAAVNAAVGLAATFLPAIVEFAVRFVEAPGVEFGPELTLWIAAAGFLHSLGMLGLYESVGWWDHLTHTVSAALVAAPIYAGVIVAARHATDFGFGRVGIVTATVAFTFALGVFWELIEQVARAAAERYDIEPVLVYYGRLDTALDLVFDLVGAVLVVVLDVRLFVPLADRFPKATTEILLGTGAVVVVGCVVMGASVGLADA